MTFKGCDLFFFEPGKLSEMRCNVCASICDVERNYYGPSDFASAIGKIHRYFDKFTCPNAEVDWHESALSSVQEIENVPSKSVVELR